MLFYAADVIVFDGFVGNIVLKFGESCMTTVLRQLVGEEMERLEEPSPTILADLLARGGFVVR